MRDPVSGVGPDVEERAAHDYHEDLLGAAVGALLGSVIALAVYGATGRRQAVVISLGLLLLSTILLIYTWFTWPEDEDDE